MSNVNDTATLEPTRTGVQAPARRTPSYRPNVDIRETEQQLLLVADLPGARPESIDVRCENGMLTLTAKVEPRESGPRRYLLREFGVGDFRRSFQLDERIDVSRIAGEFADGVLTLRLPKLEAARPHRIEVKSA